MAKITQRHIKAWQRFNDDLNAFILESEDVDNVFAEATLYEDAYTTRNVRGFTMTPNGELSWTEDGKKNVEQMYDEDDAREWLSFWRANLRRAKRYWSMDSERLDAIQDGEIEDEED